MLDCRVYYRDVIARHGHSLMISCKSVEDKQVAVQMFHFGCDDDIAKYRENLISVQHPFFLAQSVQIIKLFNLLSDAF
jgi:hypothetical protein